jgi:hypothetical protein
MSQISRFKRPKNKRGIQIPRFGFVRRLKLEFNSENVGVSCLNLEKVNQKTFSVPSTTS